MSMVLAPVRETFRAFAATVVPEATGLDSSAWADLEELVESALERRPASVKRQLRALVRAIDLLPVFRWGRRFVNLGARERTLFLASLQDAPLLLLRRGFWGLRTLVYLGYYARPQAADEIGYRADPRGWDARRTQGIPG
jgi:hypothetical protein